MSDALVRELNRLGYQPVFLPRTGVTPPELYNYARQGQRLVRRGALAKYLPSAGQLVPKKGELGDIAYKYTSSKKGEATVSFLQNALKCIGIDAVPKIDLGFTNAKDFSFAFTKVTYLSVDPSDLDPILLTLSVDGIPAEYVEDGLHIAYEYAYANELVMSRGDKKAFEGDVSGKIGQFLDVGTKGSVSIEGNSTISFKSTQGESAAFAYKAGKLAVEGDRWVFYPEEVSMHGLLEQRNAYVPQPAIALFAEDEP